MTYKKAETRWGYHDGGIDNCSWGDGDHPREGDTVDLSVKYPRPISYRSVA